MSTIKASVFRSIEGVAFADFFERRGNSSDSSVSSNGSKEAVFGVGGGGRGGWYEGIGIGAALPIGDGSCGPIGGSIGLFISKAEKTLSSESSGSAKILSALSRGTMLLNSSRMGSSEAGGMAGASTGAGAKTGARTTSWQCGHRTERPARSSPTPIRRVQRGQGKVRGCIPSR